MARKKLSEEHKAKIRAGQAAARARREAEAAANTTVNPADAEPVIPPDEVPLQPRQPQTPEPSTPAASPGVSSVEAQLLEMVISMRREMDEIKRSNPNLNQVPADVAVDTMRNLPSMQPQVGAMGVQGRVFKYPVEKDYYPDPTDRLYDEPTLKRFALRENFMITWDVQGETYEKYNISFTEPRFIVTLYRILFDEEGEPTGQAALITRHMQHEDELAARIAADRLGYPQDNFDDLMNEMRYQRIREWLVGVFTPQKFQVHAKKPMTMVIGGKAVEVYDTESVVGSEAGKTKSAKIQEEVAVPPTE